MKTTSAALLLITLILSGIFPAFGQKIRQSRSERKGSPSVDTESVTKPSHTQRKKFAQFGNIDAITDGGGTLVRWHMTEETENMGFLVYRLGKGGFEIASENLIPGSMSKLGRETMYGNQYEFFDPSGTLGSAYRIQAIGPDGSRVSSLMISSRYTSDFDSDAGFSKAELVRASFADKGDRQITEPRNFVTAKNPRTNENLSAEAANLSVHRAVVNTPGVKIGVKRDGFYRVRLNTQIAPVSSLFNAGNTTNWRLFRDGIEQAVIIGSDGNGVYMDFYGKAVETVESDTAVYYLILDPVNPGKRIPTQRIKRVEPTGISPSYTATTSKRERTNYDSSILNGDADNFWGGIVLSLGKTVNLTLTGVDFSQPEFTIRLDMQGYSASITPYTRLVLNGNVVGTANAEYPRQAYSAQFTAPTSFLNEGSNTVQLFAANPANPSGDISYFDSIRLTYNRSYVAESNQLLFTGAPTKTTFLSGFSSPNIRIFNIGTDGSPIQLNGFNIQQNGSVYNVLYTATRQRLQPIFAVEDSGLLQAASVTINNPSNLSSTVRNADLVIISYSQADFMAASNTWADYRRSAAGGSFNVEVVDVADIYDEYSYGLLSSEAVKSFLQHVHQTWTSQVAGKKYVLLVGDGSYDPKSFTPNGVSTFVPTKFVDTIYNETPADDLLTDFNGDGLAEMAIGRVPARTAAVITTIFNKTTAFEAPAMQSMNRGVLFAYDVPNGYQFGVMSEDLANQMPVSVPKTYIPRGLLPPNDPMIEDPQGKTNLLNAINAPDGKYIVNFSGHGSQGAWTSETFFSNHLPNNNSVALLTNANGPAIFTMLTCLNGYFADPRVVSDSISESLLKSTTGGGPVAWASSGKTTADVQMLMGRQFFQQIGIGNIKRMGDLVIDAKAMTPLNSDVRTTWILFGDPMLKVRE